jgi:hypothetical protein
MIHSVRGTVTTVVRLYVVIVRPSFFFLKKETRVLGPSLYQSHTFLYLLNRIGGTLGLRRVEILKENFCFPLNPGSGT